MTRLRRGRRIAVAFAVLVTAGMVSNVASAAPSENGCNNRRFTQIDQFLQCVNADDAFEHLQALQDIADANGGTRASGTPGYDASADYVAGLLEDAGYSVERQEFSFSLYTENSSSLIVDSIDIDRPRRCPTPVPATSRTAT